MHDLWGCLLRTSDGRDEPKHHEHSNDHQEPPPSRGPLLCSSCPGPYSCVRNSWAELLVALEVWSSVLLSLRFEILFSECWLHRQFLMIDLWCLLFHVSRMDCRWGAAIFPCSYPDFLPGWASGLSVKESVFTENRKRKGAVVMVA